MVKLSKDLFAVRPGSVYPEWIRKGEEVDGRLEEIAKKVGAVDARKALKGAPENKADK
ncbi:MAG: hypothetical protein R6U98_24315 [Pirellulaceae bacterium]